MNAIVTDVPNRTCRSCGAMDDTVKFYIFFLFDGVMEKGREVASIQEYDKFLECGAELPIGEGAWTACKAPFCRECFLNWKPTVVWGVHLG